MIENGKVNNNECQKWIIIKIFLKSILRFSFEIWKNMIVYSGKLVSFLQIKRYHSKTKSIKLLEKNPIVKYVKIK